MSEAQEEIVRENARVGRVGPSGKLGLVVFHRWPAKVTLGVILKHGLPRPGLGWEINWWRLRNLDNLWRGARTLLLARLFGIPTHYGALYLDKFTPHGRIPLGLASLRVVTTAGAGYIIDAFQNLVEMENMKFHGYGTGAAAEAVGDAALGTELTTQYVVDNTRPTGTQTELAANIYETVGMLDPDAAVTITEHGIFSAAAGGVLLDRSVFTGVPLAAAGDQLQATYDFTVTAGS
jgi:hypothetical protein